jgi:hypothetical protein
VYLLHDYDELFRGAVRSHLSRELLEAHICIPLDTAIWVRVDPHAGCTRIIQDERIGHPADSTGLACLCQMLPEKPTGHDSRAVIVPVVERAQLAVHPPMAELPQFGRH